mgnify:CR=1 FL=1
MALICPGVGRANAVADVYTSVNLYMQPLNDYTATPGVVNNAPSYSWNSLASSVSLFLASRIPVGTTVTVLPPTYVDIDLSVTVTIDSSYKQRDVTISCAKQLLDQNNGLFSYNYYGFGDTVSISDIYSALMGLNGILQVDISKLCRHGNTGVLNVTTAAGEIPILEVSNLNITVIGGIA